MKRRDTQRKVSEEEKWKRKNKEDEKDIVEPSFHSSVRGFRRYISLRRLKVKMIERATNDSPKINVAPDRGSRADWLLSLEKVTRHEIEL